MVDLKKIITSKSTLALALGGGATYFLYKFLSMENVSSEEGGAFSFNESDEQVVEDAGPVKKERYVKPVNPSCPILILVGTEYGLSHEVASKLEDELRQHSNIFVRIVDMEEYEMINFEKEQLVFIISSTYGDGVPPTTARPFFDYLAANQQSVNLSHIQFCVLALGDRSYPLYCAAGKLIDQLFEQCGAKRLHQRVEVDQEDWNVFDRWINTCVQTIPKLTLNESDDYLYEVAKSFAAQAGKHNKKVPYSSKLLVKRLLTKVGGDKEAYHLEFELGDSELKWIPGDSLAILAHNKIDEVKAVIALLKLSSSTKVNTPSSHYQERFTTANPSQITLEHALTKCYDLHNLKPELLTLLRDHAKNQEEKNKLIDLLKEGTSKTNEKLHQFLENNHMVDVLKMFSSSRPPINDVLGAVGKLLPRYYSIASSMVHNDKTVSLCVAIVRYELHGTNRVGVASTHMSDRLDIGSECSIYVNNNPDFRLPEDPSTPILMIGPGTGIAPFIAFIQERLKLGATGPMHLYFGSRSSQLDFLYSNELQQYAADGHIKLYTAFSRETSKKVYVQDRLMENSQEVADLIKAGGHIYVCGDAKSMAPDVHNALKSILGQHLSIDDAEADQYLHKLEKSKRYQKDTWF